MSKIPFALDRTVFVIDGSSFLYRAYYSIKPLYSPDGRPVQAVFGFCRMIKKLFDEMQPQHMIVAWDSKGKTERHELYEQYKATRQATPSDLYEQKELILQFIAMIKMPQLMVTGVEADDLIASVVQRYSAEGYSVVIVSSDKDLYQLLSDHVVIVDPFKNEIIDQQSFEKDKGFPVTRLALYHALVGDTSDNIPGVAGIGAKGATELAQQFATLDSLYASLANVSKERTRAALEKHKDDAYLSYQLFTLRPRAIAMSFADTAIDPENWDLAQSFFAQLNFKSLLASTGQQVQEQQYPFAHDAITLVTVTTEEQLQQLIAKIRHTKKFAFDTETTGLTTLNNPLVGLSVCIQSGIAYYIPCGHETGELQLPRSVVLEAFSSVFADPTIAKYAHHAQFDQLVLLQHKVPVFPISFDTMLAASLLAKDWQLIGLKDLSLHYLGKQMLTYDMVVKQQGYKNFAQVPLARATAYAATDAHQTWLLTELLQHKIVEQGFAPLLQDLELPVAALLVTMIAHGIICDTTVLMQVNAQVSSELADIERMIHEMVGKVPGSMNLNSPRQIEELLFHQLQLPPQKKSAKKTGYSTDQEVLAAIAHLHPVVTLLMRYRELYKLKSTYILSLPTAVNPHTGKIHTTLSQTTTATGRLASLDPNLQNIPVERHDLTIRSAFVPAPGNLFISADYSQIELRVLAYLSGDEQLLAAFAAGHDIHQETAAKLFQLPLHAVTAEQRQLGKTINFSILYGLTPYGLSKDLGIPFGQAKEYIERYFAQYPGVRRWMDLVIEKTKESGYVMTLWGRRRFVPGIHERNQNMYQAAVRIAINTIAQGTAAEVVKLGMLQVARALNNEGLAATIVLQIHDELLLEVPAAEVAKTETVVKKTLETVVNWPVQLTVNVRHGKNWQEVTK
ncbi:DNA polymerase I [Candidatus Dependentiae bacterium]|nr:DNA polymerase I [Candidatus Dependentiae bacterium]